MLNNRIVSLRSASIRSLQTLFASPQLTPLAAGLEVTAQRWQSFKPISTKGSRVINGRTT
jgi:hypothetical protein